MSFSVPHLTILTGPTRGQIVQLKPEGCRIGRDPAVEVPIVDARASRVHVEIVRQDNDYIARDMKSKNGTLVNGATITAHNLREGDQIQIGETRLAFSLLDAPQQPPSGGGALRRMDSVLAARLPMGIAPALGTGGMAGRATAGETFETIELSAPLTILRGFDGPSINNSTIHGPEGRAMKSLRALYAIARVAAEAKNAAELWRALSASLLTGLDADRVTPVLLETKNRWRIAEASGKVGTNSSDAKSGSPDRSAAALTEAFNKIPVSRTIVDYALRTKRSVLTSPRSDERFGHAKSIGEQGITSALCVPVISHDDTLGLIYADRLGGIPFTREDQELLTAACLLAAPALANLKRLEDVIVKKERLLNELKSQHNLIGISTRMKEVAQFIERAAPTSSVVLILGESGTGKELVARATHYNSARSDAPFIVVNCAALSEQLIESELFGHVKGSFTGATSDRSGRFEMAHEGTIFLDEIGELSNSCQTKLLRVLEQGEISRVGEGRVRKVDVRVLAATNRDLQAEVKSGRFREDLFYRLNVLSVCLPPLRERGGDVQILLEHYLHSASTRSGRQRMEFSEEATQALMRCKWPGNVRELRNLCERMAVLCPQEIIGLNDLPPECRSALPAGLTSSDDTVALQVSDLKMARPATSSLSGEIHRAPSGEIHQPILAADEKLADVERAHILKVLKDVSNNKKLAAEKLGIDRSTLYAKLRAYGIM